MIGITSEIRLPVARLPLAFQLQAVPGATLQTLMVVKAVALASAKQFLAVVEPARTVIAARTLESAAVLS